MDHQRVFDKELAELKDLILKMGIMVQGLIKKSIDALQNKDTTLAEEVIRQDEEVDKMDLDINEKCIELIALRHPEASDLRFVMTGTRLGTDLERIGDLAEDIAERVIELADKQLPKPLIDIPKMAQITQELVRLALDSFVNNDTTKVNIIWQKEDQIDKLRNQVQEELEEIMSRDPATVKPAIPLLLIARYLERIADHVTNIAEDVVYMVEARVVKHSGKKR